MKIASVLTDIKYGETTPAVSVLVNTTTIKEVRIVFKEGQEMKEHKAPCPIVVSVVEGSIDFGVGKEHFILEKGMLIALEANILHSLKALQNSILRLSLSKADNIDRAKEVVNK
ncbi:cupin [Paenimyroides tangerinum]|uniref:Cupin n=1 Tax=Paenimyroides tangerinum TaxID=2488728 RepID=A0A3P3W0Y9_9FLAO|nr:cupin domain-containing protein [Paenimyroides tangerinum]RRJ88018.1 cupin [Paenimyroides tangerinum]